MLNTTGKPNPQFYVLGRGAVLLAVNDTTTGLPDNAGYRHLGNAPAFATTLEIEEFTHRSSLSGFSEVDARAVTSREIGLSFSLDEISFDNLGLFYNGTTESITNPAVAGVGAAMSEIVIVSLAAGGVVLGRWYQLLTAYDGTGDPISMDPLSPGDLTLREIAGMTTLVENTDYELDAENGLIFLLSTAARTAFSSSRKNSSCPSRSSEPAGAPCPGNTWSMSNSRARRITFGQFSVFPSPV